MIVHDETILLMITSTD